MILRRVFVGVTVLAFLALAEPLEAGEVSLADRQFAEHCVRGLWESQERLRCGHFSAVGVSNNQSQFGVQEAFQVWFNRSTNQLRFDRSSGSSITKFARSNDESLLYTPATHMVVRAGPDAPIKLPDAVPFDLRIIGLCNQGEFEFRWPYRDLRDFFDGLKLTNVARESETLTRISWDTRPKDNQPRLRLTLCLDSKVGYQPVKMERLLLSGSELAQERSHATANTRYVNINGLWVPKTWYVSSSGGVCSYLLTLTWASVNQPIADKQFRVDGLRLEKGVAITNTKFGKPFVESVVGLPGFGVRPISGVLKKPVSLEWVLFLVKVFAFLGLGLMAWRPRRSPEPTRRGTSRNAAHDHANRLLPCQSTHQITQWTAVMN